MQPLIADVVHDGILDGKRCAAALRLLLRDEVAALRATGTSLCLAVVRVGEDPASAVYVGAKVKACAEVGIESRHVHLDAATSEAELLATVAALNADDAVDGILVQLPLPRHINETRVIESVDVAKDVDGFHPSSLGKLLAGNSLLEPCTPAGVMVMLGAAGVDLRGKNAVVVGRSIIVGKPMGLLLLRADATVTTCHSRSVGIEDHVRAADVVVAAVGRPNVIRGEWIKPGAVVIDVGVNRMPDGKLCGDVEFATARERASLITPVPGGVGPMTIAMLLWNAYFAGTARRNPGQGVVPGVLDRLRSKA
jgi:methylenetetrahydrofolate dehydrogenase (NADP+)/methenyltetrahydrofolate cyclohydrolase